MHVEDYGPSLQSGGVLLHSVARAQSTMVYSVMAMDEGVIDSPITRAPILERLNSPRLCGLNHFHILLLLSGRLHFYQARPVWWYGGC